MGQSAQAPIRPEQIEHARMLAGDFLDVSQIALGKIQLHLERASLRAILESVLATVRPPLDSVGQKVVVRLPAASLSVIADEARLFQSFALLVRFASESTREGRNISIFHTLTTEAILIHIQASGRGLTEERLAGCSTSLLNEKLYAAVSPQNSGWHSSPHAT